MEKGGQQDVKAVIVVFSFGSKGTKGNSCLGVTAVAEAQRKGVPLVVTQDDIPNVPNLSGQIHEEDFFVPFFYVEDFMQSSWLHSTLWVSTAVKFFCLHNELPLKAIVIAAPMHLRRATRDMKKVGFNVVEGVSPQMKASWYEKTSELPWTRSWWRWWTREIPLRLLPWWMYKEITLNDENLGH